MKKQEIPKGKNALTMTIEQIMKDFGGTRYQRYTPNQFLEEVINRIDTMKPMMNGAVLVVAENLKRKLKRKKNIQDMLLCLNETLFSFFESAE